MLFCRQIVTTAATRYLDDTHDNNAARWIKTQRGGSGNTLQVRQFVTHYLTNYVGCGHCDIKLREGGGGGAGGGGGGGMAGTAVLVLYNILLQTVLFFVQQNASISENIMQNGIFCFASLFLGAVLHHSVPVESLFHKGISEQVLVKCVKMRRRQIA